MAIIHNVLRLRGARRLGHISRIMVKHGFGNAVDRAFRKRPRAASDKRMPEPSTKTGFPSPVRIRRMLEELGPSFVKLGQLMSTRADIFPPEYIKELRKLQDRVPAVALKEIHTTIESQFGRPPSRVFQTFDDQAAAAASVAQVHCARLKSGEKVAVKIVRPGIEKQIREDIRLMVYVARKLEQAFEVGRVIGCVNLVREFERTVFKELDMLIEAGHMERFARHFKDVDEMHIPRVYWSYTTKSVLVMEHIDGIKMDQVDEIRAHGIDPKTIAMIGLRAFSRQLMEFGLFHADPHPGNTIVMTDGRVSLVDFGIMGYLDEETMMQIANIFLGYAEHDYDIIIEAFKDAGLIDENRIDMHAFRIDLKDLSEPFYGRSLRTISVKDVYDQIMQVVLKHRLRLPRNYLLLFKTFIQTEALGKILDSDANLLEVTRPYAQGLLERGYNAGKLLKNLNRDTRLFGNYLRLAPRLLNDILSRTAKGQHRLEVRHTGIRGLDTKFEKGINRLTMGLVISASLIAAALVLNAAGNLMDWTVRLWGHTVSLTTVFGLIGYSLATVLGLWLVISILRSGRM